MTVLDVIQAMLPACVTFGPFFLIVDGREARWTRVLRCLGALMVGGALMTTWFVTNAQQRELSALHQRITILEANGH